MTPAAAGGATARGRSLLGPVLGAVLAVAGGGAAAAEGSIPVDLELALAVDVSGSIDEEEAALQRTGYIDAFRDRDVIAAIKSGMLGRIAVAYYEWAGFGHMKVVVGWTLIKDAASAEAFSAELTKTPPETARRTAIGEAIRFGVPFFDDNGFEGTRRVLDVSGDGPNNWGLSVTAARDAAVRAGVTINGLPITNDRPSRFGLPSFHDLDLYYRDCVIGGPGAFFVTARDFRDFARAVRRKLILEIAGLRPPRAPPGAPRVVPAQANGPGALRAAPPCDIGERRWRWRDDY